MACKKHAMGSLNEILNTFSSASPEPEIQVALSEFFEEYGRTESIQKSPLPSRTSGKREFVVTFRNQNDAFRAACSLRLRPFAYKGVVVEVR